MTVQNLPRHLAWRTLYRQRRYARHLTQGELNDRIRHVVTNMVIMTNEAQFGLLPVNDDTGIWMEKFTHLLEEMTLRHGPYPGGFSRAIFEEEPLPDFTTELARKAAARMSALRSEPGPALIKFGKRRYMEDLHRNGKLRLQPASYFSNSAHVNAVKDDELRFGLSLVLAHKDIVALVRNPQDVPPDAPDQRIDVAFRATGDYLLYCTSRSLQPRLFVDFHADACVLIRDPTAFIARLREAAFQVVGGGTMQHADAVYIDPILPDSAKVFVPVAKHFKYAYQREHRFVWLPSTHKRQLSHVDLELGTLEDIAEFIVL